MQEFYDCDGYILNDIKNIMKDYKESWEKVVSIEVEGCRLSVSKFKAMAKNVVMEGERDKNSDPMSIKSIHIYFEDGNYMYTDIERIEDDGMLCDGFDEGWTFVEIDRPNLSLKEDENIDFDTLYTEEYLEEQDDDDDNDDDDDDDNDEE